VKDRLTGRPPGFPLRHLLDWWGSGPSRPLTSKEMGCLALWQERWFPDIIRLLFVRSEASGCGARLGSPWHLALKHTYRRKGITSPGSSRWMSGSRATR